MKHIDTLAVPFYEFECDSELIEEIIPVVKKLEYQKNNNSVDISSQYFYHEKLITWFEECLEKVRELYFNDNLVINVTNCWVTRTSYVEKHQEHYHHQSLIAGVLYLDDFNSGETVFYAKNPWTRYHTEEIMTISEKASTKNLRLTTKILPEKGKLILFPSHIVHGTLANKEKKTRYTIAFDSFFSGKVTANSTWPYTEIKTTSLKEAHERITKAKNILI